MIRLLAAAVAVTALMAVDARAAGLPPGFLDERIVPVHQPTALAFLPNGNLLVTRKPGQLEVYRTNGTYVGRALDLTPRICTEVERGLVGMTLDPNFVTNRFVYLYYTHRRNECSSTGLLMPANRLIRVTLGADHKVVANSEVVLLDGIVNRGNAHTGGDLAFGKDGFLYLSSGDGACHYSTGACMNTNNAARERHTLLGKIVRITRDGGIPASNPFASGRRCNLGPTTQGQTCAEIFATGLRNPFRFAFDPNSATTKFHINDVGGGKWEEINLGKAGADYGWNLREGRCNLDSYTNCPATPAGFTDPIHAYPHTTGCTSATGGVFVPNGLWPAPFSGSYLFADFTCGKIFRLLPDGRSIEFGSPQQGPVNLKYGPTEHGDQALYYTTFAVPSEVRRIRYLGAVNVPPTAKLTADPTDGALPLEVAFDASGSTDPEQGELTYRFDFGDGATLDTADPTVTHTYTATGPFQAKVVAVDREGAVSQAEEVTIHAGNTRPEVRLVSPAADYLFSVGDPIELRVEAIDAQDGPLDGSQITWEVERVHDETHSHPYAGPVNGTELHITAPPPEDMNSTAKSYLTVRVKATDSAGLTTELVQHIKPKIFNLMIDSTPTGLAMTANGVNFKTRKTFKSWPGYSVRIVAPARVPNDMLKRFCRWTDGVKTADRTIVTPARDLTLWAEYKIVC